MRTVLAAAVTAIALLTGGIAAQSPVFRSYTDSVALDVLVADGNRAVRGLAATDFEILDKGVPQTLRDLTLETAPLDVTLVIDASGSIDAPLLASLVRAVNAVGKHLRPGDRVSVITFNERIREQIHAIDAASLQAISLPPPSGQTSLNDAIAVALTVPATADRRQMAIVFTDGFDTMSFLGDEAVLDVARRSRTALFVVAVGARNSLPTAFFERLAEATGGLVQIAPFVKAYTMEIDRSGRQTLRQKSEDILESRFTRALQDFRTSYVLRYTPEGVARSGWHDVHVRVTKGNGKYVVRARRGYWGS